VTQSQLSVKILPVAHNQIGTKLIPSYLHYFLRRVDLTVWQTLNEGRHPGVDNG
jgi:hypothetical protein